MAEKIMDCDVCIVGSGAGGSVVANECALSGLRVVSIDEGDIVTARGSYRDIMIRSQPAWARQPFGGGWGKVAYPWSSRNVGGGTVFYGAASFRYRAIDFTAETVLNEFSVPLNWPYSYMDLAPYYDEMEKRLGVSGDNSQDPQYPGSNTFKLLPAHPYSPQASMLLGPSRKMGLHPFPTPLAISSDATNQRNENDLFIEEYDPSGVRKDAYNVFLRPLANEDNFTLLRNTRVESLEQDHDGEISRAKCLVLGNNEQVEVTARVFVIAANAIQTPALLQRSNNRHSPYGIGNEYGVLGRYLCFKMSEYVVGLLPNRSPLCPTPPNRGVFSTVSWTDFYQSNDIPVGLGGLIYEARYGFPHSNFSDYSIIRLECILGDQPAFYNQVFTIDNEVGIDYQAHPLDITRLEFMAGNCERILREAGCVHIRREPSAWALGSTHLHGTCRAGSDPKFSVVDRDCRFHSIQNLYVADGSFMPYPGSVNPTLTIQANALKTARHLVSLLKK